MHKRNVPAKISKLIKDWYRYFHIWRAIHYLLGVGGTISAMSVAANPKVLQLVPYSIDILAWLSAVSLALLTFLMPSRRAKVYKMAWSTLLDAANRYEHDKSYTTQHLFDAVCVGEKFIEKIDP